MDEIPNYCSYNWEQLQDARAHINRERYPINFAALEAEMEERRDQKSVNGLVSFTFNTQAPIAEVTSVPIASSCGGCGLAFYGWLGGVMTGTIAGQVWFLILVARLRASGVNPYGHDDWGFGWLGCLFVSVFICSVVGLFIGLSRAGGD